MRIRSMQFNLLVIICLLNISMPTSHAVQRTALIIGNANYHTNPLRNTINDADDIADSLKNLGFKVIQKNNLTKQKMRKALRSFGKQLEKGGVGLFFYAGHGVQVKGTNYLIPIESDIADESEVEDQAVSLNTVVRRMQHAGNSLNIIILDACRNNPYSSQFRSATRGLARVDGPAGSVIAYSTSPGSVAIDGAGRNSIYTKHLIKEMQRPNMPIELVLKKVRIAVTEETNDRQIPWESSSLIGDFIFNYEDANLYKQNSDLRLRLKKIKASPLVTDHTIREIKNIFEKLEHEESYRGYGLHIERNNTLARLYKTLIRQAKHKKLTSEKHTKKLLNYYKQLERLAPDQIEHTQKEINALSKKKQTQSDKSKLMIPPRF